MVLNQTRPRVLASSRWREAREEGADNFGMEVTRESGVGKKRRGRARVDIDREL